MSGEIWLIWSKDATNATHNSSKSHYVFIYLMAVFVLKESRVCMLNSHLTESIACKRIYNCQTPINFRPREEERCHVPFFFFCLEYHTRYCIVISLMLFYKSSAIFRSSCDELHNSTQIKFYRRFKKLQRQTFSNYNSSSSMSPLLGHRPSLCITHNEMGHNAPCGLTANWLVLTAANAAETSGLTSRASEL
jgi:hypothetical protein